MRPFYISQNGLARAMGVPPRRVNEIVLGKRSITVDTALALERVFGLSAQYWMALQADYDIESGRDRWARSSRCLRAPLRSADLMVDLGITGKEWVEEYYREREWRERRERERELRRAIEERRGASPPEE